MAFGKINKFIIVDRERFKLKLYKRPRLSDKFKRVTSYPIAVGQPLYETDRGLYLITQKAKNPDWWLPYEDWVPKEKQGTMIPGGDPLNPIRERWLRIGDIDHAEGIHGTGDLASIGTRASHGCVRMRPADVIALFDQVPINTPIFII